MNTIPPFDPQAADGCTWLPARWLTPERLAACMDHDEDHWYGGTKFQRKRSDEALRRRWATEGKVRAWLAKLAIRAIWIGASPWLRWKRVSWGHGGEVFAYADEPANGHWRPYYDPDFEWEDENDPA